MVNNNKMKSFNVVFEMYEGFKVNPIGTVKTKCEFKGIRYKSEFEIVDVNSKPST